MGEKTKDQFSKSANQAKVLRIINAASLAPGETAEGAAGASKTIGRANGDSTAARAMLLGGKAGDGTLALPGGFHEGQYPSNQEQEMRETSYFRQETDDEGGPTGGQSPPKQPKRAPPSHDQDDPRLDQPA